MGNEIWNHGLSSLRHFKVPQTTPFHMEDCNLLLMQTFSFKQFGKIYCTSPVIPPFSNMTNDAEIKFNCRPCIIVISLDWALTTVFAKIKCETGGENKTFCRVKRLVTLSLLNKI